VHSTNVDWILVAFLIALAMIVPGGVAADDAATPDKSLVGPETEKRFPPLSIPNGFQATR